jgi:hypothetical protein
LRAATLEQALDAESITSAAVNQTANLNLTAAQVRAMMTDTRRFIQDPIEWQVVTDELPEDVEL